MNYMQKTVPFRGTVRHFFAAIRAGEKTVSQEVLQLCQLYLLPPSCFPHEKGVLRWCTIPVFIPLDGDYGLGVLSAIQPPPRAL